MLLSSYLADSSATSFGRTCVKSGFMPLASLAVRAGRVRPKRVANDLRIDLALRRILSRAHQQSAMPSQEVAAGARIADA